jgi:hypothetical protein
MFAVLLTVPSFAKIRTSPATFFTVAVKVGYYDMALGQGNSNQVAPINALGYTPVNIVDWRCCMNSRRHG